MKLIRKNDKEGFTLVELIVVIAILAILALILIPAITGYIAKSNESALEASARSIYTQTAAYVAENSASDIETSIFTGDDAKIDTGKNFTVESATHTSDDKYEVKVKSEKNADLTVTFDQDGTIIKRTGFSDKSKNESVEDGD